MVKYGRKWSSSFLPVILWPVWTGNISGWFALRPSGATPPWMRSVFFNFNIHLTDLLLQLEEAEEEPIKPGNERSRSPESFSLTETDREYFNIIKTEDGLSQFYKSISSPRGKLSNNDKATANNLRTKFRYHIVTSSNKRIVGLYLPHQ